MVKIHAKVRGEIRESVVSHCAVEPPPIGLCLGGVIAFIVILALLKPALRWVRGSVSDI